MNPLVKKEIHLLLPGFAAACVLALTNLCAPLHADGIKSLWQLLPFVICPLCVITMALGSFGAEMGAGTFALLLAQPVPRQKTWNVKIFLLALAFLAVGFLWCVSWAWQAWMNNQMFQWVDLLTAVGLSGLVIFSGGLWTVLLLRQVAAAFWFTVLTPGLPIILWLSLAGEKSTVFTLHVLESGLLVYSVVGIFFARRLFLRAQDAPWMGGEIALPRWDGFARGRAAVGGRRVWGPREALEFKELQLHQSQFVIAGVLALLHLGVLAWRLIFLIQRNSTQEFIVQQFWWLWLALPLLVGCTAAAEERRLGTLAAQLCLPVRRRTQFAIKLGSVLVLSVLFGAIVPALLELPRVLSAARSLLVEAPVDGLAWKLADSGQVYLFFALQTLWELGGVLAFPALAAAIGLVSFYGSTLSRSTLQALAPALVGLALLFVSAMVILQPHVALPGGYILWRGLLVVLVGVPVLVAVLCGLSSRNWQRANIGRQASLANLLVLLATAVGIVTATAAIYHRAWEKLTPFEPPHGPARLAISQPVSTRYTGDLMTVRLPDGAAWAGQFQTRDSAFSLSHFAEAFLVNLAPTIQGRRVSGSNWVAVTRDHEDDEVGLKADGTLWVSALPRYVADSLPRSGLNAVGDGFVQYGTDTNWSSLGAWGYWLVKQDGTLWRWDIAGWNSHSNRWPGLAAFPLQRVGAKSDWAEADSVGDSWLCLRKRDGSLWTRRGSEFSAPTPANADPDVPAWRASILEPVDWHSVIWYGYGGDYALVVGNDGAFRLLAEGQWIGKGRESHREWTRKHLQLGVGTNWLAMAGWGANLVTLKQDGSLWWWDLSVEAPGRFWLERSHAHVLEVLQRAQPVRMGLHTDWIAITSTDHGLIALASDGGLWYWRLPDEKENENRDPTLLEPSRKPQFLGNVFATGGAS